MGRCIVSIIVSSFVRFLSTRRFLHPDGGWRSGILRIRAGIGRWINRKGGGAERFQVYELAAERERLCILASFLLPFLLRMFFYLKDSHFFVSALAACTSAHLTAFPYLEIS